MKILLCTWGSICENGIIRAIKNLGHQLLIFDKTFKNTDYDKDYLYALIEYLKGISHIDCVLSVNFVPLVAKVCKVFHIPYLSWTVDSPSLQLYSQALEYPTNYVFLFDKLQAVKFADRNPNHIFHMPLASDVDYYDQITISEADYINYGCDVSFIGSLYTEKNEYSKIEDKLPEYIRGYCQGLMNAQQNVFGYNFLEDAITEEFAQEFKKYANWSILPDYYENSKEIVAHSFLGVKCGSIDRVKTIKTVSNHFAMDLWTLSDTSDFTNVNNKGGADTGIMMPRIFKCSKINLNITLKSIASGLPQRIFDIMGAGGFVITNFQPELLDMFVPDEDIVYYDSIHDLLAKIEYYLNHEKERIQIAKNGYNKVKNNYTYEARLQKMFSLAKLT